MGVPLLGCLADGCPLAGISRWWVSLSWDVSLVGAPLLCCRAGGCPFTGVSRY